MNKIVVEDSKGNLRKSLVTWPYDGKTDKVFSWSTEVIVCYNEGILFDSNRVGFMFGFLKVVFIYKKNKGNQGQN